MLLLAIVAVALVAYLAVQIYSLDRPPMTTPKLHQMVPVLIERQEKARTRNHPICGDIPHHQ